MRDRHSKREGVCLYIGPSQFSKGKVVCYGSVTKSLRGLAKQAAKAASAKAGA